MSDAVSSAQTPVPAGRRRMPAVGWLACVLPLAGIAIMLLGLSIAQATDGEGMFNQIWRGVIFTVASCAMACVGLCAAVIGMFCRRGRYLAVCGLMINVAFWVLLWAFWIQKS